MRHFISQDHYIIDLANMEHVNNAYKYSFSEVIFDQFMDVGDHLYNASNVYELSDSLAVARDMLRREGLTDIELETYSDEIQDAMLQAMANTYRDNYESGFYDDIKNHIETIARESETGFYYLDSKGKKTDHFYEAHEVRFYMTEKDYERLVMPEYIKSGYTKTYIKDDRDYLFEEYMSDFNKPYDLKHFDYHGCRFDCDDWPRMFSEYEEITYQVLKDRKEKQAKIKEMIKNNVPLNYRLEQVT